MLMYRISSILLPATPGGSSFFFISSEVVLHPVVSATDGGSRNFAGSYVAVIWNDLYVLHALCSASTHPLTSIILITSFPCMQFKNVYHEPLQISMVGVEIILLYMN